MGDNNSGKQVSAKRKLSKLQQELLFWGTIFFFSLVIIGSILFTVFSENFQGQSHPIKKWSCTEKGCELSINGKYDTQEECKRNGCKIKEHKHKNVKFAKELEKYYYF